MMKVFAPLALVLVLTGCFGAPAPETNSERLVAAEYTYEAAVRTVNNLIDQGTIIPGSEAANEVIDAIKASRSALDTWHIYPSSDDARIIALTALTSLQAIIQVYAPQPEGTQT